MASTLFLVRTPNRPLNFGGMAGRFGELLAISGPEVTAASLVDDSGDAPSTVPLLVGETRALSLVCDDSPIGEVKRYTTIERIGGYVQLARTAARSG